ncbi:FecR family protein [Bacteroides helcogenes]|uniref:Anti-FecI sigma factor, FecR n=1 Tax=Bacteroides helcogenes (strain ATCC 35417 / DSM 20613 / JCM 6297 / CCUG 15421 / P 36-108) TaxID=693979 RepID=E6SPA8_BACT6|nr:FecR domain-containing protein [Bacteroides helcogenes]ADV44865.1 anti-FecI sigma factor, FecR [Bacteroides helcogenes P 36-108]MDY5239722.1 FecR domain-containing protein [Bacteroides helcogenes]
MGIDRDLLFRFFRQETTLNEEVKLRAWLDESGEHHREFLRERKLFDAFLLSGELPVRRKGFHFSLKRLAVQVASVAAVLLLTVMLTIHQVEQAICADSVNKVIVPQGQRVNMVLADGTNVWLNAKTKMEYPQTFRASDKRVVKIDGEAYFEVSRDEKKPFVVQTAQGEVEVLGTKFYISAYESTDKFETFLKEGKVKVTTSNDAMILRPNDKAVLRNGRLLREHIDDMEAYRWLEGLYCFKELPLEEVLKQFEVYYDIRFVKENPDMPNPKLTGKFRLVDGVDYALRILQEDVDFSYRRDEEENIIYLR